VIPAPFRHIVVHTVDEALATLVEYGDDARLLAGGHSLLPLMKLRLATPAVLVDISGVSGLSGVTVDGDELVVGALTRHRTLELSELVAREVPLLGHVAGLVGDPQVRNRGTIGGSIAHADPAADLPCALVALDGVIVLRSAAGTEREVRAETFFTGFWSSVMEPDEMITHFRLPRTGSAGWAYEKYTTRSQDWATVAVACVAGRVALGAMSDTPLRARGVEQAIAAGATAPEASQAAHEGTDPSGDLRASAEYRTHLATVLTERALVRRGYGI